ncbi:hypothetical protein VTK56DRAFT_10104 [Thermocarpiscus australiensis]
MATRLRCENGEWKTRDQFSKKQLQKYDAQARNGGAVASRTGIRCIEHSAKQSLELKCKGPCNRWRELRFFSKNTRHNGKDWCFDCTEWQNKTEVGETLPAPGGQLSVEETQHRLPHPEHLRDNMILEGDVPSFDDVESAFASDIGTSALGFTTTFSISESLEEATKSVDIGPIYNYGKADGLVPAHGIGQSASLASSCVGRTDDDGISISFNAWGLDGEYARMVKTPTAVSDSTRTETTSSHRTPNLGRKGWAKVASEPSRKQPPQLPDYLKYDIPEGTEN